MTDVELYKEDMNGIYCKLIKDLLAEYEDFKERMIYDGK